MKKEFIKMLIMLLIITGSASFYTVMLAMSSGQAEEEKRFGMRMPPEQLENPKPASYAQQKWHAFKNIFSKKAPNLSKESTNKQAAQTTRKVMAKKTTPDINNFFEKNIAPSVNKAIGAANKELHAALYKFSKLLGKKKVELAEIRNYKTLIQKFNASINTLFTYIKTRHAKLT